MRGLPVVVQLFLLVAAIGGFRAYAADGGAPSRPNFLIIIGDDCTYNDLRVDQSGRSSRARGRPAVPRERARPLDAGAGRPRSRHRQ